MSYHPYQGRRRRGVSPLAVMLALLVAVVLVFLIAFCAVMLGSRDHIVGNPQVMVVFGCQVQSSGPSILLRDRLDTALAYLEDHPDVTVVVSGGQGVNEPTSEALCMCEYLIAHGVEQERILLEDKSTSSSENVRFSQNRMEQAGLDRTQDVILVSNGFHLTRLAMLWHRFAGGSVKVSTLAAPTSHQASNVWMHIREPVALIKSFLLDWAD